MKTRILVSLAGIVMLAACGGGGGSAADPGTTSGASAPGSASAPSGASSPTSTPSTPTPTPTNPYTGADAPGASTTTVTGEVLNSGATVGATVNAYLVNANGTNGALIGTATTATGGTFSMTLTQAPWATASYVRFVATGGTYTSTADFTTQQNNSIELLTPYVSTAFNNFVITPLTNVASQRTTYATSQGTALPSAYTLGATMVLSLIGGSDAILAGDTGSPGVDYLALVPGTASDTLGTYADSLNEIEAWGVGYNVPSSVAEYALSESMLTGSSSTTAPGGAAINIGQWSGSTFNTSATYTLATLESNTSVPGGGGLFPASDMGRFLTWEYANADCRSGNDAAYLARWPLASGEPNPLANSSVCTAFETYVQNIDALVSTNQRSNALVTGPGYVPQTVPVVGAGS